MIRWLRQTETNMVELMKTYYISGNQTEGQKRAIMKAQHFLQVSSAIIGKHRFLDKASIQPQQTSDHHKYCSTGHVCWRGVTGESNAKKKHPNANTMLTESFR